MGRGGNIHRAVWVTLDVLLSRYRFRLLILSAVTALLGAGVAATMTHLPAPNPLLRILAPDGITLTREELANPDTAAGLNNMVRVLESAHRPIPEYLRLVCAEYSGKPRETARFSVGCYWEGERELGKIPGVVASRTGIVGREEVVEVEFDPKVIDAEALAGRAKRLTCFRGVPSTQATLVESDDQKHTLANHPELANVLMTPMQRTKVNAALWDGEDLARILSPRQLRLAKNRE